MMLVMSRHEGRGEGPSDLLDSKQTALAHSTASKKQYRYGEPVETGSESVFTMLVFEHSPLLSCPLFRFPIFG